MALSILGGYIGWSLYSEHRQIEARERQRLTTQARVIDENLAYKLSAVYSALASIRGDLPYFKAQKNGGLALNRRLRALIDALPGVRTMMVWNADGTIVASSRPGLVGQSFAWREYFKTARRGGNPDVLYVSQPFTTELGKLAINAVRVVLDSNGRFAGVVVATLDPTYVSTLLRSVSFAPDMTAALVHGEGKLFQVMPERKDLIGKNLAKPGSMFSRHMDSGRKVDILTGQCQITDQKSMVAFRTVRPATIPMNKPLVVIVCRNLAAIYAVWRRDVWVQGGLFGVLVLVSGMVLLFRRRRQRSNALASARLEEERRRSAEQYRTIIHSSLDGFWIADNEGRILDANDAILRISGYSREEFLALNISDIEADESPDEVADHIREMIEKGQVQFESRHRRKDGAIVDVEISVLHIPELGDRFFAFIRDITERKRLERIQVARLRLMEYANGHSLHELLVATLDEASDLTGSSIGFYHFLEADQKTLLLQAWSSRTTREFCTAEGEGLHYDVDEAGVWAECVRSRSTVIHNDYASLPNKRGLPPGHAAVTRELVVPVFRKGLIVAILGVGNKATPYIEQDIKTVDQLADLAWDFTETERMTEALRESEQRWKFALEGAGDGVWDWDLQTEKLILSKHWWGMLGFAEGEIDDNFGEWEKRVHPEDLSEVKAKLVAYLSGESSEYVNEYRLLCKDGSWKWVLSRAMVVSRTAEGKPLRMIGTHTDISARKQVESQLIAAKQAAENASLAKTRFLAAASHDLRQPLQAITLFNEALARTDLNEKQQRICDNLSKSVNSLGEQLNELLDISRLEAGRLQPQPTAIRAVELLRTIGSEFDSLAREKNLRLMLSCPCKELMLFSDENLLLILLRNLVSNALKYTKQGGVLVGVRRRSDHALIQVWDTGVGIAPETIDAIFEEYFQADNPERDRAKGVGLGLAIVKRLSGLLGVNVRCHSRLGRGSVFEITVPLFDGTRGITGPIQTTETAADKVGMRLSSKRIVVVEDDRMAATALKSLLEAYGLKVDLFVTAEDALSSRETLGAYCYISDYRLPGMDGVQLLDAIQSASKKKINAVLLTGDTLSERLAMAQASGWRVLIKPVNPSELLSVLEDEP